MRKLLVSFFRYICVGVFVAALFIATTRNTEAMSLPSADDINNSLYPIAMSIGDALSHFFTQVSDITLQIVAPASHLYATVPNTAKTAAVVNATSPQNPVASSTQTIPVNTSAVAIQAPQPIATQITTQKISAGITQTQLAQALANLKASLEQEINNQNIVKISDKVTPPPTSYNPVSTFYGTTTTAYSGSGLTYSSFSSIAPQPSPVSTLLNSTATSTFSSGINLSSGCFSVNGTCIGNAAGGSGSVTSVGLSLPNIFTVSNSPVTTSGNLTATLASQTANQVFAAPNGSNGAPTFRALVAADIPTLAESKITNLTTDLAGKLSLSGGTMTGNLNLGGNTINLNDGSGSGGGFINMDHGSISNVVSISWNIFGFGTASITPDGTLGTLDINAPVNFLGNNINMNIGGTGGTLNMDGGTLNMSNGGGNGGGTLNMEQGTIELVTNLDLSGGSAILQLNGGTLKMNDGSGSGGGTLNMDNGAITNVGDIIGSGGIVQISAGNQLSLTDMTVFSGEGGNQDYNGNSTINFHNGSLSMVGNNLNMSNGSGSGGGTLNMDGGLLALNQDSYFYNQINGDTYLQSNFTHSFNFYHWNSINLTGNNLNMSNGSGSGGGTLSIDNGNITYAANIYTDGGSTPYATQQWVQSQGYCTSGCGGGGSLSGSASGAINMNGNSFYMNNANGSGGNTFDMDGGTLNMSNGAGSGGGNINMDGGVIYGLSSLQVEFLGGPSGGAVGISGGLIFPYPSDSIMMAGNTIYMNQGGGTGGGTLNMDGGSFNMSDGSGSGGGTLNMDGGTLDIHGGQITSGVSGSSIVGFSIIQTSNLQVSSQSEGCAQFDSSGNLLSTGADCSSYSDQRLKTNITPLASSTLDKVLSLKPVSYDWNSTYKSMFPKDPTATSTHIGLIAQDVQQQFPDLVTLQPSGYYSLDYTHLTAALVEALQQMQVEITTLSASSSSKITDTSGFIDTLQAGAVTVKQLVTDSITAVTGEFEKLTTGSLTVKNKNISQTGITIYDRATQQPLCVYFENGLMRTSQGECDDSGTVSSSSNNLNFSTGTSTATSTVIISNNSGSTTVSTSTDVNQIQNQNTENQTNNASSTTQNTVTITDVVAGSTAQ